MTDLKPAKPHGAAVALTAGPIRLTAKIRISTAGIVAVAGLVSSILLSTTALVWVSTTPVRRHPIRTRLARR